MHSFGKKTKLEQKQRLKKKTTKIRTITSAHPVHQWKRRRTENTAALSKTIAKTILATIAGNKTSI
jgi:hypothetical protein